MRVDCGEANFTPERFAKLGIEPIVPGQTFRLIESGTYINEEVAREILEMYPRRPKITQIWMGVKDFTEITLHGLTRALPAALGGELAVGAGLLLLVTASVPRMVITGEFPSLPPSEATKAAIEGLLIFFGSLGGAMGLAGGISEARNYPLDRFIRFS